MAIKDKPNEHMYAVVGIVVVTVIAGALLLGMKIGFELGLARCGL